MKIIGIITLIVVGFFVLYGLGILMGLITVPFHSASNIVNTKHDVIDKTVNANNAIYNYEWFKQQSEDIVANLKKITNAKASLADFELSAGVRAGWTFEDKTEDARLRSIVLGLQNQQEQMVADYNARAKMANRNIFLNGIVPDFYDVNTMVGGMKLGGQNE
jgi:hypothetical protein